MTSSSQHDVLAGGEYGDGAGYGAQTTAPGRAADTAARRRDDARARWGGTRDGQAYDARDAAGDEHDASARHDARWSTSAGATGHAIYRANRATSAATATANGSAAGRAYAAGGRADAQTGDHPETLAAATGADGMSGLAGATLHLPAEREEHEQAQAQAQRVPRRLRKTKLSVRAFGGPLTEVEIYKPPRQKDIWRPNGKPVNTSCVVRCQICRRAGGTLVKRDRPDGSTVYEHHGRRCAG